jgi:branched-chain amino acid transport system ATP-binding protein
MVRDMFGIIDALNREGLAILLAEQIVSMALVVAASGYVLESGRVVLEGSNEVLRSRDRLMDAYLGKARPIEGTESGGRG